MTSSHHDPLSPDAKMSWPLGLWHVLRLSAPIVPAMLTQMLMGFFDTWMVSQIGTTRATVLGLSVPLDTVSGADGTAALAAVVPGAFACWAVMCVFVGTTNAVNTFASQSLGRGQPAEAGRYAWQSIHFAAMTTLAAVGAFAVAPRLFALFAPDPAVLALETDYFRIRIWSVPVVVLASGLSAFFQGIHRPGIPALVGIGANLLNLLFNWLLIYGHAGLPRMGIAGAAAGSLLASAAGMIVLLGVFLTSGFSKGYLTRAGWAPSAWRLGRLVWIGAPGGLSWLLDMIGWSLLIIVLVQPLGKIELAASNAAMTYLQLGFMPVAGVGIALTALTGKAIGQKRNGDARRYATCAFLIGGGYQLLVGAMFIVFRHRLIGFFNADERVIQLGAYALICAGVFQFFDAMGIVYSHALRGAGDTHFILAAHVMLILGLFIPLSWWSTRHLAARYRPDLQSIAPWVAGTLYIILLGVVFLLRWRGRRWEQLDIFGRPVEATVAER